MLPASPDENIPLKERIVKGASHFIGEFEGLINVLQTSTISTDNKLQAKDFNDALKELFTQFAQKKFLLQIINGPVDPEVWHKQKGAFIVPSFFVNSYAGSASIAVETPHPQLYQQLKKVRDNICAQRNTPIYLVAASKTLVEMSCYLPHNQEELEMINGFGKTKAEKYGKEFLSIIRAYCEEQGLVSQIEKKEPKPLKREITARRSDTKEQTFLLFKEGMAIEVIAEQRSLTVQTIQGHLAYYVEQGEIDINQLVSPTKRSLIEPMLNSTEGISIITLKQKLNPEISYGDIKLVMAWRSFSKTNETDTVP
jgi:hypothetical protein